MAARRPGLVAKKIMVKGRLKSHPRTYWVLPDYRQAKRLTKAKHAALSLPKESSAASISRWLTEHGRPSHEREGALIAEFFKKPNGHPASGDDFEQLIGNPGIHRFQRMEYVTDVAGEKVKDFNTGIYKVKPVLDARGAAIYDTIDVKTKITKLVVDGSKLKIEGDFMDPGRNESIGAFVRIFERVGDSLVAHHEYLEINATHGSGGLGSTIIRNQVSAYPELGVSEIQVKTAWVGRYTWATMGFQMDASSRRQAKHQFDSFAESITTGPFGPLMKNATTEYTPEELSRVYDFKKEPTFQVATRTIPVYDPETGKTTDRKIGKEFLLNENTDGWSGSISLTPGRPAYERLHEYLKLDTAQQAATARAKAVEKRAAAAQAHVSQDLEGAAKFRAEAAALDQQAAEQEKRMALVEATAQLRGQAYRSQNKAAQEAKSAEMARLLATVKAKPTLINDGDTLNGNGRTEATARRGEQIRAALAAEKNPEWREALVAERTFIAAEESLAQLRERARYESRMAGNFEAAANFDVKVAELERDAALEKWLKVQARAEASGTAPAGVAGQKLTPAEEKQAHSNRVQRNLTAAQDDALEAIALADKLRTENAPAELQEKAQRKQLKAVGTLSRIRAASSTDFFDDEEEQESRELHKGIEASRKLGSAFNSLAAARRAAAQEADMLQPRGPHQTRTDREVLVSNHKILTKMSEAAEYAVKVAESGGLPEDVRDAKKRLAAVRNMIAMSKISMTKTPETAEDAQRSRVRQLTINNGDAIPALLYDLFMAAKNS